MIGMNFDELYERISHCHEVEFEYDGITYVLQPEVDDGRAYLVIWNCTPNSAKCISKHEINVDGDIPLAIVDAVLSDKCFNGKSFLEIAQEVTVSVIY